ncbi:tetratricopeptide repeat protein [Kibdelosporangium aridum]|uniref:tetratricopeptide repeat protein n=1 Tax=Kibdelosporangium aridum TaxID=2030 RepID=UPI000525383C
MERSGYIAIAEVMAHCGGNPAEAAKYFAAAIAEAPGNAESYAGLAELRDTEPTAVDGLREGGSPSVVAGYAYIAFLEGDMDEAAMSIGSVVGARPDIPWADAPWFSDPAFLNGVSPAAFAEATLRTMDGGHDLDSDEMRNRFRPWFRAIDVLADRDQDPDASARFAMMLRACGRIDAAFALCDRAEPTTMMVEVVRAGTWRRLNEWERAAEAFRRAIDLEPDNWSLYLDLADARAQLGDFAAAVDATSQGLRHEPDEPSLKAAHAAYRTRLSGSAEDLQALVEVESVNSHYLAQLIDIAVQNPDLPQKAVQRALKMKPEHRRPTRR